MILKKRSIVLLSGPIGCGKSTFANRFFGAHIVSADTLREMISGDAGNQNVSRAAFELLEILIDTKMRHDFPVIVDNLNHRPSSRKDLYHLADKYGYNKVVIAFGDVDLKTCQAQNAGRARVVPRDIVEKQYNTFKENMKFLKDEPIDLLLNAKDITEPFTFDNRDTSPRAMTSKVAVIGDVHGCLPELLALLQKLEAEGYGEHKPVFVGDFADRGPSNAGTLEIIADMVEQGRAMAVRGNHDDKLLRYLKGSNVKLGHGLQITVNQIENRDDKQALKEKLLKFLGGLPLYLTLDDGKLVVTHAGIEDAMIGQPDGGEVRSFCLYGKTTGLKDADGFPERIDWGKQRVITEASPTIVYGHQANPEPYIINKTIDIDTGCCFGGRLSAYIYPEGKVVSVPAYARYSDHKAFE